MNPQTTLSVMLAVSNTPNAVEWYQNALGAQLLWSLGSVAGLEINGAPFFLHEPVAKKFHTPKELGATCARVEILIDNPDELLARAIKAGAVSDGMKDYELSWGIHRQGSFVDPFGHTWLIGDRSPLNRFP
jgi:uncharacterized glyoxalase superfamily protein PhnB